MADAPATFAFRILDRHGIAVTGFEQLHERALAVASGEFMSAVQVHDLPE